MTPVLTVAKREFAAFFQTPVGYVITAIFAAITGFGFVMNFFMYAQISQAPSTHGYSTMPDFEEYVLSPYLVFCGLMIMFLSPLITMWLIAGERHKGTIELLLTYPLRDRDIIFGKFLAAMGIVGVLLLVIAVHLGIIFAFVDIEVTVLAFGLLAVLLMGATFVSLGLFISSLTRNPTTSGTITFGLCLLFFIISSVGDKLPEGNPAPENLNAGLRSVVGQIYTIARTFIQELAVDAHAEEMAQGIFQPQDIAYYLLITSFFLFLTFRALESRNWRA